MKIPVEHVDLAEQGYPGYWLEIPKSVKEGYLHDFAKMGIPKTNGTGDQPSDADSEASRSTNIKIMELVVNWNIDDDNEKVFPLLSKVKTQKDKEAIIAEIPVDIIMFVAERITGSIKVPEATKDF